MFCIDSVDYTSTDESVVQSFVYVLLCFVLTPSIICPRMNPWSHCLMLVHGLWFMLCIRSMDSFRKEDERRRKEDERKMNHNLYFIRGFFVSTDLI